MERAGGITNQFTGDGGMALFGVDGGPEEGCQQALIAVGEMVRGLAELSRSPEGELEAPLQIGSGIHTGPAVVGRMGPRRGPLFINSSGGYGACCQPASGTHQGVQVPVSDL